MSASTVRLQRRGEIPTAINLRPSLASSRRDLTRMLAGVGLRASVALIFLMAAGGAGAESERIVRSQLERDNAARQLELKLEQLQFQRSARPRAPSTIAGAPPDVAPRGTRLPIEPLPSGTDAGAGSADMAERRRLRTLFDRERFKQRELQDRQKRRLMTHRSLRPRTAGVANGQHDRLKSQLQQFRMEQEQQLRRFRMQR